MFAPACGWDRGRRPSPALAHQSGWRLRPDYGLEHQRQLLAPIFSGGRLQAQVDAAAGAQDEAASKKVENALTGAQHYEEQIERIRRWLEILNRSVSRARDRYSSGYAAYIEQFNAERNLYSTELDTITVRQDQLNNLVQLHQARRRMVAGRNGGGTLRTFSELPRLITLTATAGLLGGCDAVLPSPKESIGLQQRAFCWRRSE